MSTKFRTNVFFGGNIPIVTFDIEGTKMNFIIDTGSEISYIDSNTYSKRTHSFAMVDSIDGNIVTLNGERVRNGRMYVVGATLNDTLYNEFAIINMEDVITNTFIRTGFMVNGIIGCDMLYDNEMIVDFRNKTLSNN